MSKLNSAQLRALRTATKKLSKPQAYRWINEHYSSEAMRKSAKQSVRRWLRKDNPRYIKRIKRHEDGPAAVCYCCKGTYHNSEIHFVQLGHFEVYQHICNSCLKALHDEENFALEDFDFKDMTVSAGSPKKEGEHGKVNRVGAFTEIKAYFAEDYPDYNENEEENDDE